MNAKFNPDKKNIHVLYCSPYKNDMVYYETRKGIEKAVQVKMGGGKFDGKGRMSNKYHQALEHERQKTYALKRLKMAYIGHQNKVKELEHAMAQIEKENIGEGEKGS